MRRFAEEMDRVFEGFGVGRGAMVQLPFGGRRGTAVPGAAIGLAPWSPQVEVFQRGDQLVVRADLPGLAKDDVQVEVTENAVTIQGERRHDHEERRENYYHSERSYGSFYRSIPLPEGVSADRAEAKFSEGVLEITMPAPQRQERRGRRLEVKS
jgi:HSP20 family protein